MNVKPKKCKGHGKAKEWPGCGTIVLERRYGLCKHCFKKWLLTSEEGKQHLEKSMLRGKTKAINRLAIEDKKVLSKMRENAISRGEMERRLQVKVNDIVREIDKNCNCISSGRPLMGKYDAGHFYSVGSTPSLRFNFHNIFAQSVEQNHHKGGNPIGYRDGLVSTFGKEYAEKIFNLRAGIGAIKLNKNDLRERIAACKSLIKDVKQMRENAAKRYIGVDADTVKLTPKQRIAVRDYCNTMLDIYES